MLNNNIIRFLLFVIFGLFFLILNACSTGKLNPNGLIAYNANKQNNIQSYDAANPVVLNDWSFLHQNVQNTAINSALNDNHFNFNQANKISLGGSNYNEEDITPNLVATNDAIYAINKNNYLFEINLNSNKVTNKFKINSLNNDSAVALAYNEDNLYISSSNGKIISIYKGGQENWVDNLLYPIQSAPIINGDKLFVVANNTVYAINLFSGDVLWKYQGVQSGIAINKSFTPTIYQNFLIVGLSNGNLLFLRKENGQVLWNTNLSNNSFLVSNAINASPIVVTNNNTTNIIASSYNNSTYMLNLLNGSTVWKNSNLGFINNPVLINNHLLVIDNNMSLDDIDINDGNTFWTFSLPIEVKHLSIFKWFGPFLVNNMLMVYNSDGYMYFISPQNGNIINKYRINLAFYDQITTNPIIINKKIILFSQKNNIYIIS